jgi:diguanylate cyclase (GGDEF)-like protein/PAS domain S-box-containing protein
LSCDSETERLDALRSLNLLDTEPSEAFDAVTRLISHGLRFPIVLVSLLDAERQWFKSRVGLHFRETPRHIAFCAHAVAHRRPLIVPDARRDSRFAANPLVVGVPRIRAYLGIPLYTRDKHAIGALCGIDTVSREFDAAEIAAMTDYARVIEEFIHGRELAAKTEDVLQYAMERERLFRETFEQAAVGIAHISLRGAMLRINQRLCDMLGYQHAELLDLTFLDISHPDDIAGSVREFKRSIAGETDSVCLEQRLRRKDQQYSWVYLSIALKRTAAGQPDYAIVVIEDISARKRAEAELLLARDSLTNQVATQTQKLESINEALLEANAKLAADNATDFLTGLPNRRVFTRRIEEAAAAYARYGTPYGLVLLDLDDFKQVNDFHGHDSGDEVLRAFGRILLGEVRNRIDVAARLGGEEFAILCFGNLDAQALRECAERIRARVNREVVNTPHGDVRFTASFGLALSRTDDTEWKSVYGRADAALYEAKANGKDRVAFGESYSSGSSARLRALRA